MKKEQLYRIFSRMPVLETERLILRPLRVDDTNDMFEYASDPEVTRYLLWDAHTTPMHTRNYLEYLGGRYRLGMHHEWAVVLKETHRMIGTCGFVTVDLQHRRAEIGYVINPRYRGRGIAVEAVNEVLKFGFGPLSLHRIEARYMVGNEASRRVMEKSGMRFEGVQRESMLVKGVFRDIGTCAILSPEMKAE